MMMTLTPTLFQTKMPKMNQTQIMVMHKAVMTMIHLKVVPNKDYQIDSLQYLMVMEMTEGKDSSLNSKINQRRLLQGMVK